jgi:hypothetical protein
MNSKLDDPNFKPWEFANVLDLYKARCGWIPPSQRENLKALLPGEEIRNVEYQRQ